MQEFITGLENPLDIVSQLRFLIQNPIFKDYAQTSAMKMVTHLFSDAGRTWREAARVNSQGRTIYESLRKELQGPIRGFFYYQVNRNAEIIKTLPLDITTKVTNFISDETIKGRRASDIALDIQKMFPSASKAKASLIARTEVSKTQTALTRARSESLGLPWYVWRTSEDSRVRNSHEIMDDVLVMWNDPPSPEALKGEKSLGRYHAGEIFNCRCYAQALITLDDVQWPHKVYRNGSITRMTRVQFKQLLAA